MIVTKFRENAWMVLVAVPLLVVCFVLLHRHHRRVREELGTRSPVPADAPRLAVVLYLERLDAAAEEALAFVGGLRGPELHALYAGEGGATGPLAERWSRLTGRELEPLPAADSPVAAVSSYVERISRSANGLVDVVVPELFETRSLRSALRRTTAFRLPAALHGDPGVVVTHVPVLVDSPRLPEDASTTTEALVLVPGLGDATSQAVRYAGALGVARTRAVHVALDADEAERVRREWAEWACRCRSRWWMPPSARSRRRCSRRCGRSPPAPGRSPRC